MTDKIDRLTLATQYIGVRGAIREKRAQIRKLEGELAALEGQLSKLFVTVLHLPDEELGDPAQVGTNVRAD